MNETRPNIVLIVADDHAAHAVGAYGSVVNTTPRIDEIATAGVLLDRCYCTNSLCTPSRASILTGTYSHVNGVYTLATPMDQSQPTFVSSLREAGYRTAIVGKWHLGDGPEHRPTSFDYWEILIDQGEYFDPRFVTPAGGLNVRQGYATDLITDLALEWIDSVADDGPYCLLIHHKAPHRPWQPHRRHAGLYHEPIPVPDSFDDDYSTRTLAARHATMRIADHLTLEDLKVAPPIGLGGSDLALWKYQRYMEDYLRCVAAVDDNVGRVIDTLRARDFDNTLLMYTSDQGFFLGDHGWFDKRFMYEQSSRMPFVVSYPARIPAGRTVDAMVTNVDIAPTILDAAGLPIPDTMQGRSFLDLLTDPAHAEPIHDAVYYRYWENDDPNHHALAHYGVRTARHKLIYFYNDGLDIPGASDSNDEPGWELYDLQVDPDELSNVYDEPEHCEIAARLRQRLHELQHQYHDKPHHTDTQ